ncbi:MAG: succinate dehydrogenase iron-sulfur subunit [Thaumarchaeota archaeon]|nr:succinate dehydrogenase iron-sulfur subunit [Nitrososphaerota archaeon]
MSEEQRTLLLRIRRYSPEEGTRRYQEYRLPFNKDKVLLDYLNHINDKLDGSLAFRWSCRMGVCGSCGAMVNGTPKLTCSTFVKDLRSEEVIIEPLENFPVIKDLVVDIRDFVDKLRKVSAWLMVDKERSLEEGEYPQTPGEQAKYSKTSMCINCALCYSACPVYGEDRKFIGPAAIALAYRYNNDSRDTGMVQRLRVLSGMRGLPECSLVEGCTAVCPKGVDPVAAIKKSRIQLDEIRNKGSSTET